MQPQSSSFFYNSAFLWKGSAAIVLAWSASLSARRFCGRVPPVSVGLTEFRTDVLPKLLDESRQGGHFNNVGNFHKRGLHYFKIKWIRSKLGLA